MPSQFATMMPCTPAVCVARASAGRRGSDIVDITPQQATFVRGDALDGRLNVRDALEASHCGHIYTAHKARRASVPCSPAEAQPDNVAASVVRIARPFVAALTGPTLTRGGDSRLRGARGLAPAGLSAVDRTSRAPLDRGCAARAVRLPPPRRSFGGRRRPGAPRMWAKTHAAPRTLAGWLGTFLLSLMLCQTHDFWVLVRGGEDVHEDVHSLFTPHPPPSGAHNTHASPQPRPARWAGEAGQGLPRID
eukprot:scaffold7242_cov400-Prasinococcus_capsulatus_cf.AAC.20